VHKNAVGVWGGARCIEPRLEEDDDDDAGTNFLVVFLTDKEKYWGDSYVWLGRCV
jgi:hypothetical protein